MYTTYDRATGRILCTYTGMGNGENRITDTVDVLPGRIPNSKYVDPQTGTLRARQPVVIRFDKHEASEGETVSLVGVPEDALVWNGREVIEARTFTMERRDLRASLIGKYMGEAHCARVSLDEMREMALIALLRETPEGKAVMTADARTLRRLISK